MCWSVVDQAFYSGIHLLSAMNSIDETLVIWNPNAGTAPQAACLKERIMNSQVMSIYEPVSAEDARSKVAIMCSRGTRFVVAAGGDGTVNSVLNGLSEAPSDVVMGVLPLGTANDWCASLAIPNDLDLAWEVLQNGRDERIDIIELETKSKYLRFANIATGGNSHRVTESITPEMKKRWGALCYIRGAIGIINELDDFKATLSFDDSPNETFSVWNLLIANGRTSAGQVEVAPRARLDDGLLDVVIIQSGTLVNLADLSARYLFSDYVDSEQVIYRQARRVTLDSTPPMMFSIDGDLVDDHPISFRCIPAALNVVVGKEFEVAK